MAALTNPNDLLPWDVCDRKRSNIISSKSAEQRASNHQGALPCYGPNTWHLSPPVSINQVVTTAYLFPPSSLYSPYLCTASYIILFSAILKSICRHHMQGGVQDKPPTLDFSLHTHKKKKWRERAQPENPHKQVCTSFYLPCNSNSSQRQSSPSPVPLHSVEYPWMDD